MTKGKAKREPNPRFVVVTPHGKPLGNGAKGYPWESCLRVVKEMSQVGQTFTIKRVS